MTDRVILKWDVPVDGRAHRIGGGQIVHVACQYYDDVVTAWSVEPRHTPTARRRVQVFRTGVPLPYFAQHLGTALAANGVRVWHLFQLPEVEPQLPNMEDVELPETSDTVDMNDARTKVAP